MGRITSSRKQLKPDPVYGSLLASKFINTLMHDGKKSVAQGVFYDALDLVKKRIPDKEPIEVFTQAVENVKPAIEVRSKRVGGAAYQVPMQVNRPRQQSLAIRYRNTASCSSAAVVSATCRVCATRSSAAPATRSACKAASNRAAAMERRRVEINRQLLAVSY